MQLRRADLLVALVLLLVGVATRLPFQSELLYDHDSFLFARAAEKYDLRLGQPHPPGYLFYVYLGKALALLAGDVNRGFLWLGAICAGLLAALLYLFERSSGLAASLLSLGSPLLWFYGEVALSYIAEAVCVTAIALACWRAGEGRRGAAIACAAVIGLSGGFRAWIVPFAIPLWLYAMRRHSLSTGVGSVAMLGAAVLTWLLPNCLLSGGWNTYWRIVQEYNLGLRREAAGHLTWGGELTAFRLVANWMWWGLGVALPLVAALGGFCPRFCSAC